MSERFDAEALRRFAAAALMAAGLPEEPSRSVATGLVEADLYGHSTHGLALLSDYAEELSEGRMEKEGRPLVLQGRWAVETWDGRRLPGLWVTSLAASRACEMAAELGLGAVAVRRSHHIGCLASFLEEPARKGFVILVFSSDPSDATIAPYGGTTPVFTPDPIAAGIPASPDPILIDISTSITTNARRARAKAAGEKLPGPWLLSVEGEVTDDPAKAAGGTILPIGGMDHGHKGFGLALLVESLTQGLGGHGRADPNEGWGASVLVLAIATGAFGPSEDFLRQVDWIADACRKSRPIPGKPSVRLPGEGAIARKREALASGVRLDPTLVASLQKLAQSLNLPPLAAL